MNGGSEYIYIYTGMKINDDMKMMHVIHSGY